MTQSEKVEKFISDLKTYINENPKLELEFVERLSDPDFDPYFHGRIGGPSSIYTFAESDEIYQGEAGRHHFAMQLAHELGHYADYQTDKAMGLYDIGEVEYARNEIEAQGFALELAREYDISLTQADLTYTKKYEKMSGYDITNEAPELLNNGANKARSLMEESAKFESPELAAMFDALDDDDAFNLAWSALENSEFGKEFDARAEALYQAHLQEEIEIKQQQLQVQLQEAQAKKALQDESRSVGISRSIDFMGM